MRIPDYILTAQTNLLRTKARTTLTILAFFIGTFTLAMTTAFSQGLSAYINSQLDAAGDPNEVSITLSQNSSQQSSSGVAYYTAGRQSATGSGPSVYTLSAQDLAKIKTTPDVKTAYPSYGYLNMDYVQYKNGQKYVLQQVQSSFPGIDTPLVAGNLPKTNQTKGIVLPYAYIKAFGAQSASYLVGKTVAVQIGDPQTNQTKGYSLIITGILADTQHEPNPVLSSQTFDNMVQFQGNSLDQFSGIVAVTDNNPTKAMRLQIKDTLQNDGYQVFTYDDILAHYAKPLKIVAYGMGGFACIVLLAATIGIINTLLMSVMERTQEIGLLKALGMRRRGITFIYLTEAASIGFWGGVIGVVVARLLGFAINPILGRTLFSGGGTSTALSYPLPFMVAIVGGAMIIGLLAGTLPAIRAGKLDPIEALRRE